jgi:hypothetical protein
VERTDYEGRLRNLHSWAGHLESTIESVMPRTLAELGPAGSETLPDTRNAAEILREIARGLDDLMSAYDVLLDAVARPRRYDDFLQGLDGGPTAPGTEDDDAPAPEINRARFARLAGELHYDVGWLLGAIHGAQVCGEDHYDEHLDGLARGIDELLISYDRLQDLIGALPARHCAFFDQMVVLEEESPRRRRSD